MGRSSFFYCFSIQVGIGSWVRDAPDADDTTFLTSRTDWCSGERGKTTDPRLRLITIYGSIYIFPHQIITSYYLLSKEITQ